MIKMTQQKFLVVDTNAISKRFNKIEKREP